VEVWVDPHDDIESIACVNAVALLLSTVHEIERARAERERRLTLWPIDEVPLDDGEAVVGGRMHDLMVFARRVATTSASVLITGESGTGKEILARAVHHYSDRADKPFIPFNCAAVPREMLESQLFGHRRGAFTSADRDNPGIIRTARGGTLFLDEVGDLSLDLQPKLLRFLESGEICPLGDAAPFTVDVRVIAATNRDLRQLAIDGKFQEDLYYRLNVIPLSIPPLRDRREDIPPLVEYFVKRHAERAGKKVTGVTNEAMALLTQSTWPGNVRELENTVERAVVMSLQPVIESSDVVLVGAVTAPPPGLPSLNLKQNLEWTERETIRRALDAARRVKKDAAEAMGISQRALSYYLAKHRIEEPGA
jgi:transcriptional regulator with PAS, ATPase and Fis domain